MGIFSEEKGQGSLEYLLIAGGAIVLAAIVIYLAFNVFSSGGKGTGGQLQDFNRQVREAQ